jgi:alkylglycerol monooxygenase
MDLIPYAVPFFLLAIALELGYGIFRHHNTYRLNDSVGSLFMGTLSTASKLVLIGLGGLAFAAVEQHYALWRMDVSSVATWVFAFVAYDLCYYWYHRIAHERQILWASHVAHHQSEYYNLTTALRQTSTGFLLSWIFYIPVFLVGVPAEVFVTVASANLIYQFWVHTEHLPKLGWYESIFVTPSNHRVHHAQNDCYVDRNYGGVFILWDRMFGTFQEELETEPCIYGIRGPLKTFSPLWANLHIYVGMAQDAFRAGRWRDKLHLLVSRTGWRPGDVEQQYPRAKTDLAHFEKYDPAVGATVGYYGLVQLAIVIGIGVALMEPRNLPYKMTAAVVAMMTLTMVCTARWLDGRRGLTLELLRLGLLMPAVALAWQAGASTVLLLVVGVYGLVNLLVLPMLNRSSGFLNPLPAGQE